MKLALVALGIVLAAVILIAFLSVLRAYLKLRGERIISCPETHRDAAVRIAAIKGALKAAAGDHNFRLSDCSRWPERKNCGQDCLSQIHVAPNACLVSNIVNNWYKHKICAYCRKPFAEIHWHDHPPALVDDSRKTVQWNEVPAEKLHEVMATHWPVCWNCHIAETFRRQFPERVVDRHENQLRMRSLS